MLKSESFLISMMMLFFSCRCHHEMAVNSQTSSISQTENSVNGSITALQKDTLIQTESKVADSVPSVCRVLVSAISIGTGIDPQAKTLLDKFVQEYMDATSKRILYTATHWGREGEMDFCFTLKNLSVEEQQNFVVGLNEVFKNHNLIHVEENKLNRFRKR